MSLITSKVLATLSTPAQFDIDDPLFAEGFTPSREDSILRVTVALTTSSASGPIAAFATGRELRLFLNTSLVALRIYTEDTWLDYGNEWNLRSKTDGMLINYARVVELFPPA